MAQEEVGFIIKNVKISKGLDMQKIKFYFDFLSPYSYFAWKNRASILKNQDIQIDYKAIPMGNLFNHYEMKGPGEILPKRHYMLKQCFIYAAQNGIEFTPPKNHPFNPLYALRMATKHASGSDQERIIDILFNSIWAKGIELDDPEIIKDILLKNNFSNDEILEKSFDREAKQEFKANIKEAISDGLFGVPSFIYNDELFWGNDSITNLVNSINKKEVDWDRALFQNRIGAEKMN